MTFNILTEEERNALPNPTGGYRHGQNTDLIAALRAGETVFIPESPTANKLINAMRSTFWHARKRNKETRYITAHQHSLNGQSGYVLWATERNSTQE